ncbi:hypothetical protein BX286_0888 [Streptomyces sp. 3211.6]|uniref:hypothetical protein n=1 Tax=Streptomyces TaxID=1883 RepID=UPI0009A492B2|nr:MULTISPECIES: hypothetical protein [Streptomyces]RKT02968.1 hypothetical protein BX286_0888 [Streptomyces sp. 3211.6]RPF29612.1 hypothetical protein EDD96_6137 [Streptomyces sp. Ag109_G2-6]
MAIDWDHLTQPRFDRIVEALVHRLYAEDAEVEVMNGRGGDGGIDIKVSVDGRVWIYQLKYFPDGFPGSYQGRRAGIKRSFQKAVEHDPDDWVLVVPCALTPQERAFVNNLGTGAERPRIRVLDRAWLDDKLALHADLESSFIRDDLREAARDYRAELAFLAGGTDDIAQRVGALGRRIDRLDLHWSIDVAYRNGAVVQTLRPKHPRAQQVSPIYFTVRGHLRDADPGLAAAVRRVVGFGTAEELVLPASAIEELSVHGPDWLHLDGENAEVRMAPVSPAPGEGQSAELVFLDDAGKVRSAHEGTVRAHGKGQLGSSLDLAFTGFRLTIYHADDAGVPTAANCDVDLTGLSCSDALQALDIYDLVLEGSAFHLRLNGQELASGAFPGAAVTRDDIERLARLRLTVEDLHVVQQHACHYFSVPSELRPADRVLLRIARLLIEGHCVANPFLASLTIELNGQDSPALRALLMGEGAANRALLPTFNLPLADRELPLGPVHIYHPHVRAEDAEQVLHALAAGHAEGQKVTLRPADGESYRLYLARPGDATDLSTLTPTPLAIPGPSSRTS